MGDYTQAEAFGIRANRSKLSEALTAKAPVPRAANRLFVTRAACVGYAGLRGQKSYVTQPAPWDPGGAGSTRGVPTSIPGFGGRGAASPAASHRETEPLAQEENIVSGMAGRYAQALFSLARDAQETDKVAAALKTFRVMIDESADLQRLVRSPVFSAEDQVKALSVLLDKAGIGGVAANFIKLVAAKRRLFAIRDMIADYDKLNDSYRGVARAEVTSAAPLSDAHIGALKDALKGVTGGKDVEVSVKTDPSIIGGLIVKLGSRMVDGSLKTKLNSLRTRMKGVG
jgi:F-type H+-transporting ATPase subunit delta